MRADRLFTLSATVFTVPVSSADNEWVCHRTEIRRTCLAVDSARTVVGRSTTPAPQSGVTAQS